MDIEASQQKSDIIYEMRLFLHTIHTPPGANVGASNYLKALNVYADHQILSSDRSSSSEQNLHLTSTLPRMIASYGRFIKG